MSDSISIEEKYKIRYVNGKRYYEFDMTDRIPTLEQTIPYFFQYENIQIYESKWNIMTIKIIAALDDRNPKSEDEFLNLKYEWSKTDIFSKIKKTNFTPYKNLFLNTNHTSTHSMMSIQTILTFFGVNLNKCLFLIKRHPSAEPMEAREYYRQKTITAFKNSMKFKSFSDKKIEIVIKNFEIINKLLASVSPGYNDFFLFDDFEYFLNYKAKTIEKAKTKMFANNLAIVEKTLLYLEEYYRNRKFYETIMNMQNIENFKTCVRNELEKLFDIFNTNVIVSNKLYARMLFLHGSDMKELKELNNVSDFYLLIENIFHSEYFLKAPFIAKKKYSNLTNEQIILAHIYEMEDIFIDDLNKYIDDMHLKRPKDYLAIILECSDDYVRISQDRLIRKSKLDISENTIASIDKEISYYIKSFDSLKSESYMGYSSLPELMFRWNKFMLAGILQSYLSEKYTIDYVDTKYKKTIFTIKFKKSSS